MSNISLPRVHSVIPTCVPTLQKPHTCLATLDLWPQISSQSNISSFSDAYGEQGKEIVNQTVTVTESAMKDCESSKPVRKSRSTKTTTAPVAKETDERIVNIGLVVALLGLLSIVC